MRKRIVGIICTGIIFSTLLLSGKREVVKAVESYDGHEELAISQAWNTNGDVSWTFDSVTGTLKITTAGDLKDQPPWITDESIRDNITDVVISGNGVSSLKNYFKGCSRLTNISFVSFDTSLVSDFSGMFSSCKELKSLDLSSFNVGRSSDFSYMFENCSSLSYIKFGNWVLQQDNVKMDYMFSGDTALKTLNLSELTNTGKVCSFRGSFYNCTSLSSIDFSKFDFSGICIWENAFKNDGLLNCTIRISHAINEGDCYFALLGAATGQNGRIKLRYTEEFEAYAKLLAAQTGTNGGENIVLKKIRSLTADNISLEYIQTEYDGTAKEPAVAVEVEGETLTRDLDYSLTYTDNVYISDKATVTVTGIGDYEGSISCNFAIKLKENTITVDQDKYEMTTAAKKQTFTFKVLGRFSLPTVKSNCKEVKATISKSGKVKVTVAPDFIGRAKLTFKNKGASEYAAAGKNVMVYVNPRKTSLTDISVVKKGAVKLNWKKAKAADGYQLRYYTKEDASDAKSIWVKKKASLSKTISGLKNKTLYYFQIRVYKTVAGKKCYSSWSEAKSITTKSPSVSSYDKLYNFIEKNGVDKKGNKQITNGNSLVYYSQTYNRFTFCYLSADKTEAVEMSIGRKGSSKIYVTYIYKKDDNSYCKSSANFDSGAFKNDMQLSFTPLQYSGGDVESYNNKANAAYADAMKLWSAIAKEAGTSMKKLIS